MTLSRRQFLSSASAASALGCAGFPGIRAVGGQTPSDRPLIVSTWPFGKEGNERARQEIADGGTSLDAVEQGVRVVETRGPDRSVGHRGRPNAAGYVQQDACIMNGPGHQAGSVAGIEGIIHPISAARRVMEHTKHVMLVGEGARWFALEQGLESVDVSVHAAMKQKWIDDHLGAEPSEEAPPAPPADSHDTIALLVLHPDGDIAGGCSTSGMGNKLPGRVGDSPILGAGLYVDNEVGAAGGTGVGENALRHCASFQVVERMRQGKSPAEACAEALHDMARHDPLGYELNLSFVALDTQGRWGAATTHSFSCSVTTASTSEVHKIQRLDRR